MEFKHIIFLVGAAIVLTIGRIFCKRSAFLRDTCAFLLVFGTTRAEMLDINFISREWYRGTTRGIEISWLDLLWILLLTSLPRNTRRAGWLPGLGPMLVFFLYNALIVLFSDPYIFGVFELSKMLRQLGLFVTIARYVNGDRELAILAWGLVIAVAHEFVYALRGRFVWGEARVAGTIGHANALSMYELMSVPVLTAVSVSNSSRRLCRAAGGAALLGAITVLLTVSRNGVLTLIVIFLFLALKCGSLKNLKWRHAILSFSIGIILCFCVAFSYGDFKARFDAEGFDQEYQGQVWEGRGAYLILAKRIAAREPFGCGLNNWSWCVSNRYGPLVEHYHIPYTSTESRPPRRRLRRHAHIDAAQAPPAHSLYAITLGETGYLGVLLFAIVWIRWFTMAGRFLFVRSAGLTARFGIGVFGSLIGAFGQSFSEWEIRLTPLAFLIHILLGAIAARERDVKLENREVRI